MVGSEYHSDVRKAGIEKVNAEILGAALSEDLLEVRDVVRWADRIVAAEAEPDPTILAISVEALGSRFDRLDAIDTLSRVSGETNVTEVTNAFMGLLWNMLNRDTNLASKISGPLYRIMLGLESAKTPSGLLIEVSDCEEREFYFSSVDRPLSELDVEKWHYPLLNFLRPYARYGEKHALPA